MKSNTTSLFRLFTVFIAIIAFTGCTSLQPVRIASPSSLQQELEVGDNVEITTKKGVSYELEVTQLGRDSLTGENDDESVEISYAAIQSMKVERVSGWKVAGWTVATILVVAAAGAYFGTQDLGDGFSVMDH